MALFVFGAGATRGCSFVDPSADPCMPPLDADFFTQLQRVRNIKHRELIARVMQDVVELFGSNFSTTLETVFSTLEHTIRMIQTTRETRGFRTRDLKEKRNRLVQAISVVLEDSLAEKDSRGHSKRTPRHCKHHQRLVESVLRPHDDVITFNYDCVLDYALKEYGNKKWHPRYGYGFRLGPRGSHLSGDQHWQPKIPAEPADTIHLYKLHGSLHFVVSDGSRVRLKQRPYTRQSGNMRFTIIPPESSKAYDVGVFKHLWQHAADAVHKATHVVIVGYSLPPSDLHSTALFRTSIKKAALRSLVVVNPDRDARRRTREVLQRGLSPRTKVLSFDYLSEFVAADREIWEV